ncbi:MAG: carbohydrate ABC transporter permease, partial [Catenulispora sp.]|nr:carbohydrate ABC transporter permease [Catenulispora sp.]
MTVSTGAEPRRRRAAAPPPRRAGAGRKRSKKALWNTLGILVFVVMGFPVYWMVNTALKKQDEWQNYTPHFVPEHPTLQNFTHAFQADNFLISLRNSFVITLGAVLISLVVGFFGALAIARFSFAGKKAVIFTVLLVQMVPLVVLVIPVTQTMQDLNLNDTLTGIVITYLVFTVPYTVWTLRGFISNVPRELDEAALVDGCSRWQTFTRIILPLTGPGLVATS